MACHHGLARVNRARRLVEVGHGDGDTQHLFLAPSEDRQRPVRRYLLQRLGMVEIVGEFGAVLLLALGDARRQMGVVPQPVADRPDQVGILGEAFGQDVARAFQRGRGVGDVLVGIHIRRGRLFGDQRGVGQQRIGQRLQPGLAGDHRLGAALLLVGQIEIFQPRLGIGLADPGTQFLGELALLLDALQDRRAALLHLAQIDQPFVQQAKLHIVQPAGGLLAIARDEGNRRAPVKQRDGGRDLFNTNPKFPGNPHLDTRNAQRDSSRSIWVNRIAE